METEDRKSVIGRKAKGARSDFDARVMSPSKSLRLALAKVADKMFGLAVTVATVEQVKIAQTEIQKTMSKDSLLLLLDGAAGARGAVAIDAQLLTALIEVQTMGKVRAAAADPRPYTRTDAAIVAPLLDAVMARYDAQLAADDPDHVERGFRFGDMMEDARTLALALEAPDFDMFRLTLDIGEGAKTGLLVLMLPHLSAPVATPGAGEAGGKPAFNMEKSALEAQVPMDAVLTRLRLPLNKICALEPGALLPLPADCLAKTQLVASGGHVVARVKLGQMNGLRAVRFVAPVPVEEAATKAAAAATGGAQDILEGTARSVPDARPVAPGTPGGDLTLVDVSGNMPHADLPENV